MAPRGTPLRNVRIDDERWTALGEAADDEGTDRSALIRDMIDVYLEGLDITLPPPTTASPAVLPQPGD